MTPTATNPRTAWAQLAMTAALLCGAPAQEWTGVETPARDTWSGVYDARRQRFVRIGPRDDSLLEWNGTAWQLVATPPPPFFAPAHRSNYASCFDGRRGRVYILGGNVTSVFGDMWFWNGVAWTQVSAVGGPSRREGAVMADDAARDRVVLFGGRDVTFPNRDTWEFDGVQWISLGQTQTASWTTAAQMVYDAARGNCVLLSDQTYTSNGGGNWVQVGLEAATATTRLTYDPVRQLAVGFRCDTQPEFLTWNGVAWSTSAAQQLPVVTDATLYFDSRLGKVVLSAESLGLQQWAWDGAVLQQITTYAPSTGQAWFHDPVRRRSIAFGGLRQNVPSPQTLAWDGLQWLTLAPVHTPQVRSNASAVFDSARSVGLLFGGSIGPFQQDDLWSWDGSDWSLLASGGPPARSFAAMAFDAGRGRAVLFGGLASGLLADLWEWDGVAWAQRQTAVSPSAGLASMAYDPQRATSVLFLGSTSPPQTWEWDGTTWTRSRPTLSPPQQVLTSATYDAQRGRVVVAGLGTGYGLWEFDGVTWARRNDLPDYPAGVQRRLVWDANRGVYSMLGDDGLLELRSQVPVREYYGSGCGGPPTMLMPDVAPRVGESRFGFELAIGSGFVTLLGVSATSASTPLGGGCTLLIGPTLRTALAAAGADGIARFSLPIPANPALVGVQVFAQGGGLDAVGQLRVSQGIRIVVGD